MARIAAAHSSGRIHIGRGPIEELRKTLHSQASAVASAQERQAEVVNGA